MSNAPRITPADIEANIKSCHFFTAYEGVLGERFHHEGAGDNDAGEGDIPDELKLMTICVMVLQNGYTVIGTSACASPENFDKEIGQTIARKSAFEEIWPLMGYRLKSQLYALQSPYTSDEADAQASAPSKGGEADRQDEGHDAVGTGVAEAALVNDLESAAEHAEEIQKIQTKQRVGDHSAANVSDPFNAGE